MTKVLLLNPPARERVCRDDYCGHVAKGDYYWPQIDLLALSGVLHQAGCELSLLDAVVDGLTAEAAEQRIGELRPEVIVSLAAAISWTEDMAFLAAVRARTGARILVSGDFPRSNPAEVLAQHDCVDAVILDYADCDIASFLNGADSGGRRNIATRSDPRPAAPAGARRFAYPTPRHELYDLRKYHSPHVLRRPFTVIVTDFGCPYRCDYCYFERIGHKKRDLSSLRAELEYIRSLGIRDFIVQDFSFGAVKAHALQVCEVIRSVSPDFSWVCELRADSAEEELLGAMQAAGCHMVMIGVESPNEEVMARHGKPQSVRQVEDAFLLARRLGLRTLAHFVIGLSGENPASIERLIRFSIALDPDIASFNIARPAWNTSFRDEVQANGWLLDDRVEIAASHNQPIWESPDLSGEQMARLCDEAVRRFYGRPSYILRQLRRVRSPYQLSILIREGRHLLKQAVRGRWMRRAAPPAGLAQPTPP